MFNPAAFSMPLLAGGGGLGAGAGAAGGLAGLGAAMNPIGWPALGLSALGTIGNLFGGQATANKAQQQMQDQFATQFAIGNFTNDMAQRRDAERARDELALANSQLARQTEARDFRKALAGKYGYASDPFSYAFGARMSGSAFS